MSSSIVKTKELSKTYVLDEERKVKALRDVNLQVEKGDVLAIMGPSGSGKTTLLNLIGGIDRPTSGEITVAGFQLEKMKASDLTGFRREKVGFVFQLFNLIPNLTAMENVTLPLMPVKMLGEEKRDKAMSLLSRVGLERRRDHRATQLSAGEQQRVAIARALVNDPEIVLADEPTGNLDTKTGIEIINLMRQLNREKDVTLIIATHDPEISRRANRIIYLKDGEIGKAEDWGLNSYLRQ